MVQLISQVTTLNNWRQIELNNFMKLGFYKKSKHISPAWTVMSSSILSEMLQLHFNRWTWDFITLVWGRCKKIFQSCHMKSKQLNLWLLCIIFLEIISAFQYVHNFIQCCIYLLRLHCCCVDSFWSHNRSKWDIKQLFVSEKEKH